MTQSLAVLFISLLACSAAPSAWAYGGGGGGGSSCAEMRFYDESPAKNAALSSLSEVAAVASDNADTSTLVVTVNGQPVKPELTQRRSGEWDVKARLPQALDKPGKVRIAYEGKSKEGCATLYPYFVEIK